MQVKNKQLSMADAQMLFREWQMRHSDGKSQSFKNKQVQRVRLLRYTPCLKKN